MRRSRAGGITRIPEKEEEEEEEGREDLVLMENRSRLCGACVSRRQRDVISPARAREPDAEVNTSESARRHCRINGKDCLFNRVTGSSASTDLN